MRKGLFVPSNKIDGIPFSGDQETWLTFDDEKELQEFINLSFKMPQKRELEFNEEEEIEDDYDTELVTLKKVRAECTSYVFDGDAPYYNDNAQSVFKKAKAKQWVGDDDCIFGNVLFLTN